MVDIINYVRGEAVDPATGLPLKQKTIGSSGPGVPELLNPTPATSRQGSFAPGFASNLTEQNQFYDAAPAPTINLGATRPLAGNIRDPNKNSAGERASDAEAIGGHAGKIRDFGSWVDAAMAGGTMIGFGGPIKAAGATALGLMDPTDSYNTANQQPGWGGSYKDGLTKAAALGYSGAMAVDYAQKYAADKVGYPNDAAAPTDGSANPVGAPTISRGDSTGSRGGSANETPGTNVAEGNMTVGEAGLTDADVVNGGGGRWGNTGNNNSGGGSNAGNNGGGNGGYGSDKGGGLNAGDRGFRRGGYVTQATAGMPTSAQRSLRPNQAQPAKPAAVQRPMAPTRGPISNSGQRPNMETGGPVVRQQQPGYKEGGFVPRAGFEAGGMVTQAMRGGSPVPPPDNGAPSQAGPGGPAGAAEPGSAMPAMPPAGGDRMNPPAEAIADDGVMDNQPINANEGEFVINNASSAVLGPEILNALNNPDLAQSFRELFDDFASLSAGASAEGGPGLSDGAGESFTPAPNSGGMSPVPGSPTDKGAGHPLRARADLRMIGG